MGVAKYFRCSLWYFFKAPQIAPPLHPACGIHNRGEIGIGAMRHPKSYAECPGLEYRLSPERGGHRAHVGLLFCRQRDQIGYPVPTEVEGVLAVHSVEVLGNHEPRAYLELI